MMPHGLTHTTHPLDFIWWPSVSQSNAPFTRQIASAPWLPTVSSGVGPLHRPLRLCLGPSCHQSTWLPLVHLPMRRPYTSQYVAF